MPALEALGRILACLFHPLVVASNPWLPSLALLQLLPSVYILTWPSSLCVSVSVSSCTNSIHQDPVSKQGHTLEVEDGHECFEDAK